MQHIVLFKFDAEKLAQEFPGNGLQEGVSTMRAGGIPGLIEVNMSERNVTPWAGYQDATQGYTHALVSRHLNVDALHIYADHPAHKALQARFFKCLAAPPLRMELEFHSSL
ncbi:Stress responsive A/B Barrel Domain [Novymonas esmeraldas]|uniref:Stress responsive A/B Barrel Domain n=1 Tax=Novymonas esmeraldas TaxID=1808958 RepID=A0AAW0F7K4_9TRYP